MGDNTVHEDGRADQSYPVPPNYTGGNGGTVKRNSDASETMCELYRDDYTAE